MWYTSEDAIAAFVYRWEGVDTEAKVKPTCEHQPKGLKEKVKWYAVIANIRYAVYVAQNTLGNKINTTVFRF